MHKILSIFNGENDWSGINRDQLIFSQGYETEK